MLRPSRPMMRPLSSSDLSSTTETVVSTAWLDATRCITAARMLRDAAVGVAAGLLLDLADQAGAVVAQLVLELAQQDLLGLAGAEARTPARARAAGRASAAFSSSRSWSRLRAAVVERALALARAPAPAQLERLSFARSRSSSRAISARRASSSVLEPVAPGRRGRRRRARPAGRSPPGVGLARSAARGWAATPAPTARGRCTSSDHGHRDSAPRPAPQSRSPSPSPRTAHGAPAQHVRLFERCRLRGSETAGDLSGRPPPAHSFRDRPQCVVRVEVQVEVTQIRSICSLLSRAGQCRPLVPESTAASPDRQLRARRRSRSVRSALRIGVVGELGRVAAPHQHPPGACRARGRPAAAVGSAGGAAAAR